MTRLPLVDQLIRYRNKMYAVVLLFIVACNYEKYRVRSLRALARSHRGVRRNWLYSGIRDSIDFVRIYYRIMK